MEADTGFWLPVDAEEGTQSNWIGVTTVTLTVKAMSAKHVMIVADSCYSGTLVRAVLGEIKTGAERIAELKRLAEKRSRTALVSGGLEPVADAGGYGHAVFARAFLKALRENTEVLDGQRLFSAIRGPVVLNAEQTPQYSDLRLAGHDGGNFLFVPVNVSLTTTQAAPTAVKPEGPSEQMELSFWEAIKDSTNPAEFEAYLRKFPSGVFAGLARIKLDSLQPEQAAVEPAGEPPQAMADKKTKATVAGDLFPAKPVFATDILKIVSKDAHRPELFTLPRLPAVQFERAELEAQGDFSRSVEVVVRDGGFTVIRWEDNKRGKAYESYFGFAELNGFWNRAGNKSHRETLKVFDVKQAPFTADQPVIDGVSAQDLSVEFKWDIRLYGKKRYFTVRSLVTGTTVVPVVVNGTTYRLGAFSYSRIIQNRHWTWRSEGTGNYVPVLGAPATGDFDEPGANKMSWKLVSVTVSDEVLKNVKAAAVR